MSCPNAPFWEDAEAHELSQITKLWTYNLVPLPPGHSAIGSKWVYKIKCDNIGNIIQYSGIDFFETYAPFAQIESVHILLSIAASLEWEIHLINIDSAFLNSDLPDGKDIYLKQPPGYVIKGKEDHIWHPIQALYSDEPAHLVLIYTPLFLPSITFSSSQIHCHATC